MKRCYFGFTLAEVLITLAIIGVVAALSIPAVISNSQQQEYKTGLKKAVSVLNSAIITAIALDGESPYDNTDLYNYLKKHMSTQSFKTDSLGRLPWSSTYVRLNGQIVSSGVNFAFYTVDGMRFEFEDDGGSMTHLRLHESDVIPCIASHPWEGQKGCNGCGSYGLRNNPNNTTEPPCVLLVDVNGDRKPNPANINSLSENWSDAIVAYKVAQPGSKLIGDIFSILITEDRAIPYGVVAQKAMYEAQKQGF